MRLLITLILMFAGAYAFSQEIESERDPATIMAPTSSAKRHFPGGENEEDLRVQNSLPEVQVRTDARNLQKEVFKTMYNQELKDETTAPVEE